MSDSKEKVQMDSKEMVKPDSFKLDLEAVRIVSPHIARDRPLLGGLHLEPDGALVATNGVTLAVMQAAHTATRSYTLVADWRTVAKWARRGKQKKREEPDMLDVYVTGSVVTITAPDASMSVQGRTDPAESYPYWRNIICPHVDSLQPAGVVGFDPSLFRLFPFDVIQLAFSSPTRAVVVRVSSQPRFYGLVMPTNPKGHLPLERFAYGA